VSGVEPPALGSFSVESNSRQNNDHPEHNFVGETRALSGGVRKKLNFPAGHSHHLLNIKVGTKYPAATAG